MFVVRMILLQISSKKNFRHLLYFSPRRISANQHISNFPLSPVYSFPVPYSRRYSDRNSVSHSSVNHSGGNGNTESKKEGVAWNECCAK